MSSGPEQSPDATPGDIIPATQAELNKLVPTEPWPDATLVQQVAYETGYHAANRLWELQELARRATHDELTGALNRWGMRDAYGDIDRRSHTAKGATYVLLIDVDDFTTVNNTHGHPAGDRVLRQLVETMQANARETDITARFGGDEFVLILPFITGVRALQIGQNILKGMERDTLATVSIGIGRASLLGALDETLAQVDEALYAAKHAGGNHVAYIVDDELR